MQNQMKKNFRQCTKPLAASFVLFSILGVVFFGAPEMSHAQRLDEGSKCLRALQTFAHQKHIEFGQFINTHFRSEKPTSELIPTAIERYRLYKKEIREHIAKFFPQDKTLSTAALQERPQCERAAEEDFKIIKELLYQHITENAYSKKSTRLLDTYKRINTGLEKLNFTIAQMYGYFSALSQKLPCYATKCVRVP